ncbi:BTB/POZ and MATH domain-containing protein 3 [Triticum urartu]|uniref:BTB/POZ and MATH domain-containing protein 3 n=1 Tax=Triticum urartu TaxID=4572 RepID=M8ATS0_TRIUA|nr:BTB/POZ and MATH domain-containing protein 3 [Triticum urartu]
MRLATVMFRRALRPVVLLNKKSVRRWSPEKTRERGNKSRWYSWWLEACTNKAAGSTVRLKVPRPNLAWRSRKGQRPREQAAKNSLAGEMAKPEARITTVGSSAFRFRVDYEQSKKLPVGKAIHTDVVSAGGHHWRIEFFPRGQTEADKGEYVSIFFRHMSKTRRIRAIIEAFVIGSDGKPSSPDILQRTFQTFEINGDKGRRDSWGRNRFAKGTILEKIFLAERNVTFVCTIILIDDKPAILVPPSDIGAHLGRLLDHTDGTDVSFIVGDETFHAHRSSEHSSSFCMFVHNSPAICNVNSMVLYDQYVIHQATRPRTCNIMLRFIYTDELPGENDLEDYSAEMFQDLLAAADRYCNARII